MGQLQKDDVPFRPLSNICLTISTDTSARKDDNFACCQSQKWSDVAKFDRIWNSCRCHDDGRSELCRPWYRPFQALFRCSAACWQWLNGPSDRLDCYFWVSGKFMWEMVWGLIRKPRRRRWLCLIDRYFKCISAICNNRQKREVKFMQPPSLKGRGALEATGASVMITLCWLPLTSSFCDWQSTSRYFAHSTILKLWKCFLFLFNFFILFYFLMISIISWKHFITYF